MPEQDGQHITESLDAVQSNEDTLLPDRTERPAPETRNMADEYAIEIPGEKETETAVETEPVVEKVETPAAEAKSAAPGVIGDDELIQYGALVGATPEQVRAASRIYGPATVAAQIYARLSAPQQAQPQAAAAATPSSFKIDLPLVSPDNPEGYDPKLVEALNKNFEGIQARYDQKVAELEQTVGSFTKIFQQLEAHAEEQDFDSRVARLSDEYAAFYGKGSASAMDRQGKEYQNRLKTFKAMKALREAGRNGSPLAASEDELFQMAMHSVLGNELKNMARQEITSKVEKRSRQVVGKPTNGAANRAKPGSDEYVINRLASRMREAGMLP